MMGKKIRSGDVRFDVEFVSEPLGGCRGRYDVAVRHGRSEEVVQVGAPTALLADPLCQTSVAEIAETVARFLAGEVELPLEFSGERIVFH